MDISIIFRQMLHSNTERNKKNTQKAEIVVEGFMWDGELVGVLTEESANFNSRCELNANDRG